jgi:hypothetical protein
MENTYTITETQKNKMKAILVPSLQNTLTKFVEWHFKGNNETLTKIYANEMIEILEAYKEISDFKPDATEDNKITEIENDTPL